MEELEASSFDDVMSPGFEAVIKVSNRLMSSSSQFDWKTFILT